MAANNKAYKEGGGFSNDLWEILAYGELLKHEFYLILKYFGWVSYSNNFIKNPYNRAHCILIHNFLELGKIRVSKVHRKIRSPVSGSRIRPQDNRTKLWKLKNTSAKKRRKSSPCFKQSLYYYPPFLYWGHFKLSYKILILFSLFLAFFLPLFLYYVSSTFEQFSLYLFYSYITGELCVSHNSSVSDNRDKHETCFALAMNIFMFLMKPRFS